MDIGIVSSRYARALLRFAIEKGEEGEVYRAMERLGRAFISVPMFRDTLESPTLEASAAQRLLMVASGEPKGVCMKEFLGLVVRHRRIDMVQFMARSYVEVYRKHNKLVHSRLVVADKLDDKLVERLRKLLSHQTEGDVEFTVEVDPSIIGGFVMEYDTYCYDASLRTRLKQIKRQLTREA